MNLSEALAREAGLTPARILHGARAWKPMPLPSLAGTAPTAGPADPRTRAAAEREALQAQVDVAFRDGIDEGRRQAQAEAQARDDALGASLAERCEQLVQDLDLGLRDLEERLAEQVLQLAMTIGEKIACQTVTAEPARLGPVITEALTRITTPWRELEIQANPADCGWLEAWLRQRPSTDADPASATAAATRAAADPAPPLPATMTVLAVRAEPAIAPGGCRIRVDDTHLDATLPTRIARTLDALGGRPAQAPAPAAAPAPAQAQAQTRTTAAGADHDD